MGLRLLLYWFTMVLLLMAATILAFYLCGLAIGKSERHKKSQKTVVKSSRQRFVLIVTKSLSQQVTDRFSVQRTAAIKKGKTKRKQTEK